MRRLAIRNAQQLDSSLWQHSSTVNCGEDVHSLPLNAKALGEFMKKFWLFCLLLVPLQGVTSQEPAPEGFKLWTTASLSTVSQTLSHDAPSDPHHFAVQLLSDFPNDAFMLVHREADGQPELHETQVDVIFVQSGSATLLVG